MNEILHYYIKVILKFVFHVFWIFPVKSKRVTLLNELSYSFGDNLKYFAIYLNRHRPGKYEIVFPVRETDKKYTEEYIYVKPLSLRYFYYLLTSEVIITNAGGTSYLPLRSSQKLISTWHGGGPYKKSGTDVIKGKWYIKESRLYANQIDFILSSCKYQTEEEFPAQLIPRKRCVNCGMPRNDIFFQKDEGARDKVREEFGVPEETKIVMYAPTFRSDAGYGAAHIYQNVDMELNYSRVISALEERFGGDWVFAVRLHPKLRDVKIENPSIINWTGYPDIQELLYTADVVISDYSSLVWDFSFTLRPCFLFTKDLEKYERERGFYMPSSMWPFAIAHDNDEMERNILEFNEEKYIQAVKQHHIDSGSFETGHACQKLLSLIESGR